MSKPTVTRQRQVTDSLYWVNLDTGELVDAVTEEEFRGAEGVHERVAERLTQDLEALNKGEWEVVTPLAQLVKRKIELLRTERDEANNRLATDPAAKLLRRLLKARKSLDTSGTDAALKELAAADLACEKWLESTKEPGEPVKAQEEPGANG